jgi:CheY-like chemotaxis protein
MYIVDDDDGHSELIQSNLIDAGFSAKIRRFSNGYDALEAIFPDDVKGEIPLLMLLDLNMPGMHGTKVLEKLRSDERTKALPVIILSTSCDAEEINHCYSLGCNLYLKKPVAYDGLISVVQLLGQVVNSASFPNNNGMKFSHNIDDYYPQ